FYQELASGGTGVGTSPALPVAPHGGPGHGPAHVATATPPAAAAYGGAPPAYTPPPAHAAHFTPAGGQTFPTSPQPQAQGPARSGGGGKGLILGLVAVGAVLAIVAVV